jgi:hypothetical protein
VVIGEETIAVSIVWHELLEHQFEQSIHSIAVLGKTEFEVLLSTAKIPSESRS